MKWIKFKIKTVTEAEDIIISTLYDIGLEGAQIEDKIPLTARDKEQMFVDILPEAVDDDGIAYLSFFVEEKEDDKYGCFAAGPDLLQSFLIATCSCLCGLGVQKGVDFLRHLSQKCIDFCYNGLKTLRRQRCRKNKTPLR